MQTEGEKFDYDKGQFYALMIIQVLFILTVFALLVLWHLRHSNGKTLGEQMEEEFLRENGVI